MLRSNFLKAVRWGSWTLSLAILLFPFISSSAIEKKWVVDTYKEIRSKQFYTDKNGKEVLVYTIEYSCHFQDCELFINGEEITPDSLQKEPHSKPSSSKSSTQPLEGGRLNGITDAHNQFRLAQKLSKLEWNAKLSAYAQEWANILKEKKCSPELRPTPKLYGENITVSFGYEISPFELVSIWSKEENNYNKELHSCLPGKVCKNYKEMIDEKNKYLGCAITTCPGTEIWVCNYSKE